MKKTVLRSVTLLLLLILFFLLGACGEKTNEVPAGETQQPNARNGSSTTPPNIKEPPSDKTVVALGKTGEQVTVATPIQISENNELAYDWTGLAGNILVLKNESPYTVAYGEGELMLEYEGRVYGFWEEELESVLMEATGKNKDELLRYTIYYNDEPVELDEQATGKLLSVLDTAVPVEDEPQGDEGKTDQSLRFVNELGMNFRLSVDHRYILPEWNPMLRLHLADNSAVLDVLMEEILI